MKKFLISFFMFITLFSIIGCSNSEIKDGDVTKVFVYGSLRSDMYNYKKYLDGKVIDNQKGTIKGELFHLDGKGQSTGYPAVVTGDNVIKGELMQFKDFDATLKELDELESYKEDNIEQNEYNRKLVDVTLEDGSTVKAYYYEYNLDADCNKDDNRIPVECGDWKKFLDERVTKVFVYGSLRSDMYNYKKYLDGKVIDNQKGTIKGDLFHLDGKGENTGYPAVIPGEGIVKGELMEFKAFHATLDELDELESYKEDNIEQNEYNRKLVDVTLEDGSTVKAYYYEYNLNADCNKDDNRVPVKDGDWKEFMESKM